MSSSPSAKNKPSHQLSARKLVITGKVQGVGFRFFTKGIADQLNITGFVTNNPDSSVTVVCLGSSKNIDKFQQLVSTGTPYSQVLSVSSTPINPQHYADYQTFEII